MLDVIKVVLQLFPRVLEGGAVRKIQLRPAGDPGLDAMSIEIMRDLFGELVDKEIAFRPWTDDMHVALQHIDDLRNFIDS